MTLERVNRVYEAAKRSANTIQGKIKVLNQATGSSSGGTQRPISIGLMRLNLSAIKSKIKIPVINVGSEVPTRTNAVAARSCHSFFLRAAKIPSDTPTESQRTNAPIARERVTGNASATRVVTHSWRLNEYPNAGAGHSNLAAPSPYSRPTKSPLTKRPY